MILGQDKEKQAEARGRRLGASGQLQIVQMFMAKTIEEAQHAAYAAARAQPPAVPGSPEAVGGAGPSSAAGPSSSAAGPSSAAAGPLSEGGTAGRGGGKRKRADEGDADERDEAEGRQAALLNSLKLLRESEADEAEA